MRGHKVPAAARQRNDIVHIFMCIAIFVDLLSLSAQAAMDMDVCAYSQLYMVFLRETHELCHCSPPLPGRLIRVPAPAPGRLRRTAQE